MCARVSPSSDKEVQMISCDGHGKDSGIKWEWIPVDPKSGMVFCCILQMFSMYVVASLFSTGVDNEKGEVDNEKALELDNRIFSSFQSDFNIEIKPKIASKYLLHSGCCIIAVRRLLLFCQNLSGQLATLPTHQLRPFYTACKRKFVQCHRLAT